MSNGSFATLLTVTTSHNANAGTGQSEIREIDKHGKFGSYVCYKPQRAKAMVASYPSKYNIYCLEVTLPTDKLVWSFDWAPRNFHLQSTRQSGQ